MLGRRKPWPRRKPHSSAKVPESSPENLRLYTIPPSAPFLTTLARAILAGELPLPGEEERQDFVQVKLQGKKLASVSEIPAPALAKMSAGLSRINLDVARLIKRDLSLQKLCVRRNASAAHRAR